MIRLADTNLWLDVTSAGWLVVRFDEKGKTWERFGPFTSPRHVLQQRKVSLPKAARRDITAMLDAIDNGAQTLAETPPRRDPQ